MMLPSPMGSKYGGSFIDCTSTLNPADDESIPSEAVKLKLIDPYQLWL